MRAGLFHMVSVIVSYNKTVCLHIHVEVVLQEKGVTKATKVQSYKSTVS